MDDASLDAWKANIQFSTTTLLRQITWIHQLTNTASIIQMGSGRSKSVSADARCEYN